MKVLILNSGMGTRLGKMTAHAPKAMTKLKNDSTIISRQLDILKKAGCKDFFITTGPFEDILKKHVQDNCEDIKFTYINNSDYENTNYIYSIYLAREHLRNDDILLLHGDLVFNKAVAESIIASNRSQVVVSTTQEVPKDDFKAVLKDGKISKIGVEFLENSLFCQAFYYLKQTDWMVWIKEIEKFIKKGETKVYAENALNKITDIIELYPLDIKNELCSEVDTIEDLEKIKKIL